jgi:platelet-activating factor acetylhydrolase IB subunit alpha
LQVLRDHAHDIESVHFSPATLTVIETADGRSFKGVAAPGNFLVSASRDKTIKIWETATGQLIATLVRNTGECGISLLVVVSFLYSRVCFACVRVQIGHDNWVRAVQFHPNGKYIISVSDDRSIKVWDLKQMKAIKTINDAHAHFVSSLDFHKNVMATGGVDDMIKIWACGEKLQRRFLIFFPSQLATNFRPLKFSRLHIICCRSHHVFV